MIRTLNFIWALMVFLTVANAFADEVYFLEKMSDCRIEIYHAGKVTPVNPKFFRNVILNVRTIPSKPELVAFKFQEKIFVTKEICVVSAKGKDIDNRLSGNEYKTKQRELSEKEKFILNKYFVEFDTGFVNVSDSSSVGSDYNNIVPTNSTNPTTWGEPGKSDYKAGALISLGFGVRLKDIHFLAFKIRFLNGSKSDPVNLIDQNTSLEQPGTWTYEDSFKNFYGGYKFIFRDYSEWKPVVGAYLGLSHMSSTLSDGTDNYKLSSIGIAALLEAGVEYHLNAHVGLGATVGFEYLGKRSMKFSNEEAGSEFKTKMSYSNQYLALGVKYYFR